MLYDGMYPILARLANAHLEACKGGTITAAIITLMRADVAGWDLVAATSGRILSP